MPSPDPSHRALQLRQQFSQLFATYTEALDLNTKTARSEYMDLAYRIRNLERGGSTTESELDDIASLLNAWRNTLMQIEADFPIAIRIAKLHNRYTSVSNTIRETPHNETNILAMQSLVAHNLAQLDEDMDLHSETALANLEGKITNLEVLLKPSTGPAAVKAAPPAYVEEIIQRANVRSTAFQRAPPDRQRTILKPFAKDILQRDQLKTDLATMISSTLHYMKGRT